MEEISEILKEIKNIREELYIHFDKNQKRMQEFESLLLDEYSLRENIELLRKKIKKFLKYI